MPRNRGNVAAGQKQDVDNYEEVKGFKKFSSHWKPALIILGVVVVPLVMYIKNLMVRLPNALPHISDNSPAISFSVIIPARNEDEFLAKTINYFVTEGNPAYIQEFVLFDDASDRPLSEWIYDSVVVPRDMIKIIRSDEPLGLIIGRVRAAEIAESDYLFFLDGHCKPFHYNWAESMIKLLLERRDRLVSPLLSGIDRYTWQRATQTVIPRYMMFDWTFQFYWQPAPDPAIPVLAGGVYTVNKDYFFESGSYDEGLKEWGAENIEQSIRIWSCGGEIILDQGCDIGHIFDRDEKPNEGNKLIERVHKNHVRVARVWLDGYQKYFYKFHHSARRIAQEVQRYPSREDADIADRLAIRHKCKPFQWYVERFRYSFDLFGLIEEDYMHLQDSEGKYLWIDVTQNKLRLGDLSDVPKCKYTREPLASLWINYNGRRSLKVRNEIEFQSFFVTNAKGIDPRYTSNDINLEWSLTHTHSLYNKNATVFFEIDRWKSSLNLEGRIMSWLDRAPFRPSIDVTVPEDLSGVYCILNRNGELKWGSCSHDKVLKLKWVESLTTIN